MGLDLELRVRPPAGQATAGVGEFGSFQNHVCLQELEKWAPDISVNFQNLILCWILKNETRSLSKV